MLLGSFIFGITKIAIFAVQKDSISMMDTVIILAVYILGVYMAFSQLQKWTDHKVNNDDEYQTIFVLSLLSWLIFPIYGIVCLMHKAEED